MLGWNCLDQLGKEHEQAVPSCEVSRSLTDEIAIGVFVCHGAQILEVCFFVRRNLGCSSHHVSCHELLRCDPRFSSGALVDSWCLRDPRFLGNLGSLIYLGSRGDLGNLWGYDLGSLLTGLGLIDTLIWVRLGMQLLFVLRRFCQFELALGVAAAARAAGSMAESGGRARTLRS